MFTSDTWRGDLGFHLRKSFQFMPATIKHLVVLMMENRSFDHMLGFM